MSRGRCRWWRSNVLVAGSTIKLTDFGIAKVRRAVDLERSEALTTDGPAEPFDPDETASIQPALTRAGGLVGSPRYMAPELGHGAELATPQSDVFSLGYVAYEMLTARAQFERPVVRSPNDRRAPPEPAPSIASLVPELPAALAAIIDACLELAPERRPDAATIARAFASAPGTAT